MKASIVTQYYEKVMGLGLRFILAAGMLSFLLVFLTISLLINANHLNKVDRLVKAKQSILNAFERTVPNPPSPERIQFLDDEAKKLLDAASALQRKTFFWTRFNYSDKERLEFKENLFDLSQSLEKLSASKKVVFEKKSALPSFEQILPGEEDLPKLFMVVDLSEELRKSLIAAEIPRIQELNFPDAEVTMFGKDIKRYQYVFKIKMEATWKSLGNFLEKIGQSENLWRVEKIAIENKPPLAKGSLALSAGGSGKAAPVESLTNSEPSDDPMESLSDDESEVSEPPAFSFNPEGLTETPPAENKPAAKAELGQLQLLPGPGSKSSDSANLSETTPLTITFALSGTFYARQGRIK